MKPMHIKPALYAQYYQTLKDIATTYGYNLLIHGSLSRDLDLVAVPWDKKLRSHRKMIKEFTGVLGGKILIMHIKVKGKWTTTMFSTRPHNRITYVINLYRWDTDTKEDKQYYLDISVMT